MNTADAPLHDLTGQLLIAMPGLADPRFQGSVVLICRHSTEGAMGLILNKPMTEVTFAAILSQLDIPQKGGIPDMAICYGGPVDTRRGFVLHSTEYQPDNAENLAINDDFALSATTEILRDIAAGLGPARRFMALGYAGWSAGQLEDEIGENSWLTAAAPPDLVFGARINDKWSAALSSLGISPLTLSSQAGRA